MRSVATVLAVVAYWGLSARAADDKPYKSDDGKYTIQFPAKATVKKETKKASDGGTMHAVIADLGAGKKCAVIFMDVPGLTPALHKDLFESAEKAALKQEGDKIMLGKGKGVEHGKDKLPGYEFVVLGKEMQLLFKTRMVVSGTRVYTIVVGDGKTFASSDEAERVLNSFELVK
jgi:hypothetical protein